MRIDDCLLPTYKCCSEHGKAVQNFLTSHSGQDKLLKFAAEGVFPIVSEVAFQAGASGRTMSNINKGQNLTKTARDITAFFNIFRGMIFIVIETAQRIVELVRNLFTDQSVPLIKKRPEAKAYDPVRLQAISSVNGSQDVTLETIEPLPQFYTLRVEGEYKHNEVAQGWGEKLLQLGAHVGSLIANIGYMIGFGVSKPCATVRKHFDVKYGRTANKIADIFPHVMVANHAGGALEKAFELAYLGVSYNRAMNVEVHRYDPQKVQKDHDFKVINAVMGLFEKMLELLKDVFMLVKAALPMPATLALGLAISGLGLVQTWRKETASVYQR